MSDFEIKKKELGEKLTAISDGIRELSGETSPQSLDDMARKTREVGQEIDDQSALLSQLSSALHNKVTGYERGRNEGYADALAKRTDLVITENGEYTPAEDSTGFKSVSVAVELPPSDLDALIDGSLTEVNSGVTNIDSYAFYSRKAITQINLPNAERMGNYSCATCEGLASVDFPNLTSVGDFVFRSCKNLTSANLPKLTTMGRDMFSYCEKLEAVNMPNITNIGAYAFQFCNALKNANFPKVTSFGTNAFDDCDNLEVVDFPNLTDIPSSAFTRCDKLSSVNIPNAISIGDSAFASCKSLKSVDFPNVVSVKNRVFEHCQRLANINMPNITSIGSYMFTNTSIVGVDFPKVTNIATYAFQSCGYLKSVILRGETMCTLNNTNAFQACFHILGESNKNFNPTGAKDGYIYVPRALLSDDDVTKDYRRATNWATYASQFRALEDYTVDGTITGALDPNKI